MTVTSVERIKIANLVHRSRSMNRQSSWSAPEVETWVACKDFFQDQYPSTVFNSLQSL